MDRAVHIGAWTLQCGTFAAVLWVALRRFAKTHSYPKLVLVAWAGIFGWSLVNCLGLPLVLWWCRVPHPFDHAPEMTGITACALGGWIFGLQLALLVCLYEGIRWCVVRLRDRYSPRAPCEDKK